MRPEQEPNREVLEGLAQIERERGVAHAVLVAGLEDALAQAYLRQSGAASYARVELNQETGGFTVYALEVPPAVEQELARERGDEPSAPRIDPKTGDLILPERQRIDRAALVRYRDLIKESETDAGGLGRDSARTALRVLRERVHEAAQEVLRAQFEERLGELAYGVVTHIEERYALINLGPGIDAMLPVSQQIPGERLRRNRRIRCVIADVSTQGRDAVIIVSRRAPDLVAELFRIEVQEVEDGLVEIVKVARHAGYRAKVGVRRAQGFDGDPAGALIGPRGVRIRSIVSELGGERVDVVPLDAGAERMLTRALGAVSPRELVINEEDQRALVVVADEDLEKATGERGHNLRLAQQLTGYELEVITQAEFAERPRDDGDSDDESGRCAAVLRSGRRCPNQSVPGSSYCGLDAHQALAAAASNG